VQEQGKQKLRAVAYCRVSSVRQAEEGLSLDEQAKRVRSHIAAQGWHLVEVFVERGVSGRKADRPELDRLLLRLNEVDVVVVPRLDRVGRNAAHLLRLFERFEDEDVRLVSLSESIDTSTAVGRLLRSVLSAMAEFESDSIGDRVRSTMRARVERGRHVGKVPYGYQRREGELRIVDAQAEIVRRIYSEYRAGRPQLQIARGLNADQVPPPGRAKSWYQGQVRWILGACMYRGQVELHDEAFEGTHAAIVTPALWDEVAALREANVRVGGRGRGRPPKSHHLFVRGFLKCSCGASMRPRSDTKTATYACYGRFEHGPEHCPQEPVRRELVDRAVMGYFEEVGLDVEATRKQIEEQVGRKLAEVRALLTQAEVDEREAGGAFERVKRDYTRGALPLEHWLEFEKELASEHKAAKAKLARLRKQEKHVAEGGELKDAEEETLRQLAEIRAAVVGEVRSADGVEAVRAALHRLFDGFTLHRLTPDLDLANPGLYADLLLPGGYVIEPHVKPTVIEGYAADGVVPVLKREPVSSARTNYREGSITR
jgi:site-specific DNA recombinase